MDGTATLGYDREAHTIELVVPPGTKHGEIAELRELVFGSLIARLPRGCQTCLSGDNFNVRESLDNVIRVNIENLEVM